MNLTKMDEAFEYISDSTTPSQENVSSNFSGFHDENAGEFERLVRIIVPTIFGLIVVIGLVGNLLVIIVVLSNKQMQNTTNILIVSLAVADLSFIIFCVPFTAATYAIPRWPFGNIWCKAVQYMMYVCAYASVYTLVIMSLDRYLAVVHPLTSMRIRTVRNTYIAVYVVWITILLSNIPILLHYGLKNYDWYGEERLVCINLKGMDNMLILRAFYGCFFAFGYVLPLALVCVLYGFMLKRLLYGVVPGGSQRAESIRSKKRVTRMVVIVVVIFALCWLPIQIIFIVTTFGDFPKDEAFTWAQIASNCLAYMNSCVNPILYAFLSENFRRSFRKLLCCSSGQSGKFDYERTNIRGMERETKETKSTMMQTLNNSKIELNNCHPHSAV